MSWGDFCRKRKENRVEIFLAAKQWRAGRIESNVMGGGLSTVFPCFTPANRTSHSDHHHHHDLHNHHNNNNNQDLIFTASEPLDETLGHSFVYVRSSARFLSPTHSDRFVSPSQSLRFSPSHDPAVSRTRAGLPEATGFRTISGASVSANTSTPRTVLQLDNIYDDATETTLGCGAVGGGGVRGSIVNGFESTASFCALPLQPVPRGGGGGGGGEPSGPMERGGFFLSGPIERGALSGPLDANAAGSGADGSGRVHFSAPLGGPYVKRRRKKGISGIRKAFYRNFSEKKRPWVVPVLNFVGRKESSGLGDESEVRSESSNVHWALGKAGEDRVHVVVSEEQGWLFVGIYDGFNGPDAPEFLMGNLYRAVHNELQGLFWEVDEAEEATTTSNPQNVVDEENVVAVEEIDQSEVRTEKRVTFQSEETERPVENRRRRLRDFLAEDDAEDGLDLSGSQRFAFSVDDALSVSNGGSAASRRWLLLTKLKQGLSKHREGHGRKFFPWRFGLEDKEKVEVEVENRVEEERSNPSDRRRKEGPVDHELVLGALSRALEVTELAYLDMTDKVLDTNPELALMGSCLLVVLMRDEDVYVMNVGDSRAIVAQYEPEEVGSSTQSGGQGENGSCAEGIVEESLAAGERAMKLENEAPTQAMKLTALQLSTDHSTSIEEVSSRFLFLWFDRSN